MSRLEIALLGTPEIRLDGNFVKTDRRKAIALLAYLACTGRSHTREHLAALFWPDYARESAYAYLRRTLWEVNQMLGKGWLDTDRERAALDSAAEIWLDTAHFQNLLLVSRSQIDLLTEVVALYRGDFLEGFNVADTAPFEEWQFQQAAFFRREYASVLQDLVKALAREARHDQALPYAYRWLALDPLDEAAHRALLRLLAEMGDRSGAIRQYETCVQTLKKELGIAPQPETTRLYQAILLGEEGAAPFEVKKPSKAELTRPVPHLPVLPTPFIGRRDEVEQIKALIQHPAQRLVTLTGPGGTGKTRLSIQVASEVSELYPDGVCFAALAATPTAEAVLPALAQTLNISFYEGERPRQQLLDLLRGKQMLIVLDNFEHLLEACELIVEILSKAPGVKLLVTSRVRLNIQGEQLYQVQGMHSPGDDEAAAWVDPEMQAKSFSAIQLFLERARRVQPNFKLTDANLYPILKICRLVQGMPLGLELAAAWLELLTPDEIAAEITHSLDILETNQMDVPERQRSVRAVFESSWKMLSEAEQTALQRLCVFRGSFSRAAAQQVSGASLRTLLGLVEKSWLQQIEGGRFQLHELLRHYGQEQLRANKAEWREAHNRHAAYFTQFAAEQNMRLRSSQQLAGKQAYEEELNANIRIAWDWLVAERRWANILEPFAIGLLHFGMLREQMADLIPWLRETRLVLASDPETATSLAFAIIGTLEVFCEDNEYMLENRPAERLQAIWQVVQQQHLAKPMGIWFVLLAFLVHIHNLDSSADSKLEVAVAELRQKNDPWMLGMGLYLQAVRGGMYAFDEAKLQEAAQIFKAQGVLYEQGMIADVLGSIAIHQKQPLYIILEHYNQAKQFFTQMGDEVRATLNYLDLAGLFFRVGLSEQGFDIYHETQRVLERVGNWRMLSINLHWESLHASRYSTFEHSLRTRQRNLELVQKTQNQTDYYLGLLELGEIYRIFGDMQKARSVFEEAYPGLQRMNLVLGMGYYERAYGDMALEDGRCEEALARYEQYRRFATQDNHPWSMAQSRSKRALALAYLDQGKQARLEIGELIREIRSWGEDELLLNALLVEPVCWMLEGSNAQAVEMAAFIQNHRVSWNETRRQAQGMLERAARNLLEDTVRAAIQRSKELKLDAVLEKILS